jgi:hypothetical protein
MILVDASLLLQACQPGAEASAMVSAWLGAPEAGLMQPG